MFDTTETGIQERPEDNWALVVRRMNGEERPSGFCRDCVSRRTERCPMRVSVWVGGYDTDFSIYDNTVDMGFCHKWTGKPGTQGEGKEREQ